jgi:hypothetical protein
MILGLQIFIVMLLLPLSFIFLMKGQKLDALWSGLAALVNLLLVVDKFRYWIKHKHPRPPV